MTISYNTAIRDEKFLIIAAALDADASGGAVTLGRVPVGKSVTIDAVKFETHGIVGAALDGVVGLISLRETTDALGIDEWGGILQQPIGGLIAAGSGVMNQFNYTEGAQFIIAPRAATGVDAQPRSGPFSEAENKYLQLSWLLNVLSDAPPTATTIYIEGHFTSPVRKIAALEEPSLDPNGIRRQLVDGSRWCAAHAFDADGALTELLLLDPFRTAGREAFTVDNVTSGLIADTTLTGTSRVFTRNDVSATETGIVTIPSNLQNEILVKDNVVRYPHVGRLFVQSLDASEGVLPHFSTATGHIVNPVSEREGSLSN
jgi:hypothetical protein